MNEVVICVEVNNYWMKQQSEKGELPFAKLKGMLAERFPEVLTAVKKNTLEIRNVKPAQNAKLRQAIKDLFAEEYKMSIEAGDYNLTARTSPVHHVLSEQTERPSGSGRADHGGAATRRREKSEAAFRHEAEAEQEVEAEQETEAEQEERIQQETEEQQETRIQQEAGEEQADKAEPDGDYRIPLPELDVFLTEYSRVLVNAKKFKLNDIPWSMNILLSMDSGYGVSEVAERIADVLAENGYVFNSKTNKPVAEYIIPEDGDVAEHYWEKMLADIRHYYLDEKADGRRSANMPFVFLIDLTECLGEIRGKRLYTYLQRLLKIKGSFLYIFRIPYVEAVALNQMQELLADLFRIRTIAIAPFTNEQLVAYLKSRLRSHKVVLNETLDRELEQLIAFEKKDGRFAGLKTIEKLATDIVYKRLSRIDKEEKIVLSKETLSDCCEGVEDNVEDPEEQLARLCGMDNVKQTLDEIISQIKLYQELKKSGKKLSAPTMHMRFVGNPGTGKTTVARLVAQIFKQNGILNKGFFYEIKARDLCGRYVGETAPKTSGYCRDALGSVLFIDEAYTLYHGEGRVDYGQEAIETLLTEMEINRDNLVVIMAGYKKEMDELLKSNPGLQSRMPYEIAFRNYTKDELIDIFYSMLGENFGYTDGFDRALRSFINSIPDSVLEQEEFSNARMVRNLYERIWSKAAYRKQNTGVESVILQEDDVEQTISDETFHQLLNTKTRKIGF